METKDLITAGGGLATGIIGMLGQNAREKRAMKNQQKLMGIQKENQMELNQQGYELQKRMWDETNYEAQMQKMKEAGLNESLMYGMKGGGGVTTGSQGGGSAQGGSAPSPQMMGIDAMTGAQIALLKAQKTKTEAETSNIKGEPGTIGEATINKLIAETQSESSKQNLMKTQEIVNGYTAENVEQNTKNLREVIRSIRTDASIKEESKEAQIDIIKNEAAASALDKLLKQSNIDVNEQRIKEMAESILQKWKTVNIGQFKSEIEAEYPGTSKIIGKALNEIYDLFGDMTDRDANDRTRKVE